MWILGLKADETGLNIFNVAYVQTHPPLSKKNDLVCTQASFNVL